MSNLPLDMPDNYPWLPGSGKSQLGDLGELAARLKSPITYDRRGNVFFVNDFSFGLGMFTFVGTDANNTITLSGDYSINGGFSAKLQTETTNSILLGMYTRQSPQGYLAVGIEIGIYFKQNIKEFYIYLPYIKNSIIHSAQIKYDLTNGNLYYLDNTPVYVLFDTIDPIITLVPVFNNIKLVVDSNNNNYIRFLFNSDEYDLSNISLAHNPSADVNYFTPQCYIKNPVGSSGIAYIDRFILTTGDI